MQRGAVGLWGCDQRLTGVAIKRRTDPSPSEAKLSVALLHHTSCAAPAAAEVGTQA